MSKLSDTMWNALNEQIKYELESSYLYLGMAAWLNDSAYPGFAAWMRVQAKEEVEHAMKISKYIEERGNRVELLPIAAPAKTWPGVKEAMEAGLEHEKVVTGLINKLMDMAIAEKDHATAAFLQWFVTEQVEEEESFRDVVDRIAFIKPGCSMMLSLDKHMGKRGSE